MLSLMINPPKRELAQANHGRVKLAALSARKLSCMSHEPGADADCLSAARHCSISASLEEVSARIVIAIAAVASAAVCSALAAKTRAD